MAKERMYQRLWEMIAQNTSEKPVKVRCPVNNQARLIRAVRKEKCAANVLRRDVDAVNFGKLRTSCEGDWVYFQLDYNGDMI